jgi:hypothetical protein
VTPGAPWIALAFRGLGFAASQAAIAGALSHGGRNDVRASSLWLASAALTNLATLLWLRRATRREGVSFASLFRADRARWRSDLAIVLALGLVGGPAAYFPTRWLAERLWSDPDAGTRLLFQPAPLAWIVASGLVFATTQPFAELPAYCGYALPRLERRLRSRAAAAACVALALAAQHAALPLHDDPRFALWRALSTLPLAAITVVSVAWRPSLLPWFLGAHFLADVQLPVLAAMVATGAWRP